MIFVTLGTTRFGFNRLLRAVDRALVNLDSKEKLIVQKGNSAYFLKYKNKKVFKELNFTQFLRCLKKARVIIAHAGPGTVFLSLKFGQSKPLIAPRLIGEHVDNHQYFFGQFLKKRKMIKLISRSENLVESIILYLQNPEKKEGSLVLKPAYSLVTRLLKYSQKIDEK